MLVDQGAVQREWFQNHYEYKVNRDVDGNETDEIQQDSFSKEEEQAERIRAHLAKKHNSGMQQPAAVAG